MQYVIEEGENIYDVAIKLYGDSVFAVKIVLDNSQVLNLATSNIAGLTIEYDETIKPSLRIVSDEIISDSIAEYHVKEGQSIYDLAIMFGYGVENIIQFVQDLELSGIKSDVTNLIIFVSKNKTNLSDYIDLQNKVLATDTSIEMTGILTDDGDALLDDDGLWISVD